MKRNVNHVQRENRDNPHVETADRSVFENMQKELEALKAQIAKQNSAPAAAPATAPMTTASTTNTNYSNPTEIVEVKRTPAVEQILAMTNSGGGSLSMRTQPDLSLIHI